MNVLPQIQGHFEQQVPAIGAKPYAEQGRGFVKARRVRLLRSQVRILKQLETRAAAGEAGSNANYLLAVQRYFTGDPRARDTFRALARALPEDATVALFVKAVEERFKAAAELPPVK